MSVQQVTYEVGLKDRLSGGLRHMAGEATNLGHELLKITAGAVGIFASFEFLKSTVEDFNEAQQASAQLNATMKSTANIAGLNRKALDEQAEALMNTSLFDDDDVTRAQSVLATFTNIRGEVFMNTIPAIADLSTKMGTDLKTSTIQVAKAMNDLSGGGLSRLKKSGVDFSEAQQKLIKHLFATNKVAEAQTIILQELQKEFGGSAAAAAEAGTGSFTVLQHQFQNVKEEIGGMLVALGIKLMPTLKKFVAFVKEAVDWVKKNSEEIKRWALAIGQAYLAFKAAGLIITIVEGIGAALTAVAAGGLPAFGAAITTALGPVGLFIVATTTAIGLISKLNSLKFQGNRDDTADDAAMSADKKSEEDDLNKLTSGKELKESLKLVDAEIKKRRALADDLRNQAITAKNAFASDSLNDQTRTEVVKTNAAIDFKKNLLNPPKKGPSEIYDTPAAKPEKTKATGAKSVTINVDIKELIGIKDFNTTNVKESMSKVHDAVVAVMTGAVNDFQVVASTN